MLLATSPIEKWGLLESEWVQQKLMEVMLSYFPDLGNLQFQSLGTLSGSPSHHCRKSRFPEAACWSSHAQHCGHTRRAQGDRNVREAVLNTLDWPICQLRVIPVHIVGVELLK